VTHYRTLGVGRDDGAEDIKIVWRRLAAESHPDRHAGDPGAVLRATERFARISGAYAVLSDRKAREAYDRSLDLTTDRCPDCRGSGYRHAQVGLRQRRVGICAACEGCGRKERTRR
jgi:DnaJ-class molecular chaperone